MEQLGTVAAGSWNTENHNESTSCQAWLWVGFFLCYICTFELNGQVQTKSSSIRRGTMLGT